MMMAVSATIVTAINTTTIAASDTELKIRKQRLTQVDLLSFPFGEKKESI